MTKAVVYTIVATAYFLLVLVLYQVIKANDNNNFGPKGRLNRRLGYKIPPPPPHFDPLVAKIERLGKKQGITTPNHHLAAGELKINDVKYFDDDGRLNITLRLMVLFPVLDRNQKDGFINFKELEVWIVHQAIDRLKFRTQQVLESRDRNGDGFISFFEYLPQFSNQDIGNSSSSSSFFLFFFLFFYVHFIN